MRAGEMSAADWNNVIMERPGRNDPCYCGSGKKYKQCHMAADLAADRENRAWADASRDLRFELLKFADDDRFQDEAGAAAAHYWDNLYTADTVESMSPSEAERFFDWFIFDHSSSKDGERVVDAFRNERGPGLSSQQRELLDRWAAGAPMGGYELTGYERQMLQLREIVSGDALEVYEPGGHGNATTGSIIIGRPVAAQDRYEFFSMPAYIPTDEIADLREKLAAAREADDAGNAADFMRRHNVMLIHHALEQAKIAGRPPVARLDPHRASENVHQRARHERARIKGPSGITENAPQPVQSRRKAI